MSNPPPPFCSPSLPPALCFPVQPWSKPTTLFHRFAAEIATRVPAARWLMVKGDDWVYGARYEPASLPEWAR